mgnify:FL=1
MGATEAALSKVAGFIRDARLDLAADLLRLEDAEDCRSFLADLCKSLPLDLLAFHSDPQDRVQLSPGYRALDVETARLVAWAGWGFATQRRAPLCGWQSVRIARAFWSDTQLVCHDVDGEIESMADDALSNLRAVESQMESDEAEVEVANYWERRAMR